MEVAAPCPPGLSETMIVLSPIVASLRWGKHPREDREGVHRQSLLPVHALNEERGIEDKNGILLRLLLLGNPNHSLSLSHLLVCLFSQTQFSIKTIFVTYFTFLIYIKI